MGRVFIGTSGFFYNHWQEIFYPDNIAKADWLSYYSRYFDTVEIDSSFYRTPLSSTYENWFKKTPEDFTFSLKGSRFITHIKRLVDIGEPLKIFFSSTNMLSSKFKVVLWQFGSGFKLNLERLEKFLVILDKEYGNVRHSFEFRHDSWFSQDIYDLLKKYKASLVVADSPSFPTVKEIISDFIYIRFHGSGSLYGSNYKDEELKKWAKEIKGIARKGIDAYCYFNNDIEGFAIKNALTLKKLCQS